MNINIIVLILLAVVIIVLIVVLLWPAGENSNQVFAGIWVFSPKPNEVIPSPVKITGQINGNGWIAFEAQVGIVKLFDEKGNELALGILTVTDENWMKVENNFETTLNFIAPKDVKSGKLIFYSENPSGDPNKDKTFILPIRFK